MFVKDYSYLTCTGKVGGNDPEYVIKDTNKDIPRYFKLHLDDGLERISQDVAENPNLIGYDYLFDKIHKGLEEIC